MTAVVNPIKAFQLRAQLRALQLEAAGFRRKGPTLASMLRKQFGLHPRASYARIQSELMTKLEELEATREQA